MATLGRQGGRTIKEGPVKELNRGKRQKRHCAKQTDSLAQIIWKTENLAFRLWYIIKK